MTPRKLALLLVLLGAGGCTTVDSGFAALSPNCSQDWYDAGFREGRFIGQPCDGRFDQARYTSGWEAGVSARPAQPGA